MTTALYLGATKTRDEKDGNCVKPLFSSFPSYLLFFFLGWWWWWCMCVRLSLGKEKGKKRKNRERERAEESRSWIILTEAKALKRYAGLKLEREE